MNNKGFEFFRCSLKHLACSSFYENNENSFIHNISKEENNALKNLAKDKSIVVMKPDKGNGIVLMNKADYISKVLNII